MTSFVGQRACLGLGLILFVAGCQPAATTPSTQTPPSKVTGGVKEDTLTTVELTEEAEKRLGIETSAIEMHALPQHRTYGGEVTLPTDATITVSATVAGQLQLPKGAKPAKAGAIVAGKQPILTLLPLVLTPSDRTALAMARNGVATQRADAAGLVQQAQTQVDAARIALNRAERLDKDGAGSKRVVDEAQAQLTLSEKALEAAMSRKKIVDETQLDEESNNEQSPLVIEAPQAGIIRAMHALPGEVVMAGAPLFEIMNTESLWIRVPVYVGETDDLAIDQPASIGELASRPGQERIKAEPLAAPPTATALASTVDLYYALPNAQGKLRPGQRVSVQLPLRVDKEQRAIPWSAVVQDIHGGSWIYEQRPDHKYIRRRVQVKQVVDKWAVLEQGPPVGTTIVVTGVAEVFGTEFWVQK